MHLALAIEESVVTIAFVLRRKLLRLLQYGIDFVIAAHVGHEVEGAADFIHAVVAVAHEFVVLVLGGHEVAVVLEEGNVEDARVPAGKENIRRVGAALDAKIHDHLAHFGGLHERRLVALIVDLFHMIDRELGGGRLGRVLEKIEGLPLLPEAAEEIHLDHRDLQHFLFARIHSRGFDIEHENLIGDGSCHRPFKRGSGQGKSQRRVFVKCLKFLDNYFRPEMAKKIRGF